MVKFSMTIIRAEANIDNGVERSLDGEHGPSIREKVRLLFVNAQESRLSSALQIPPYRRWIESVAQISEFQLEVIDVADGATLPAVTDVHGIIGGGSEHAAFEGLPWMRDIMEFFLAAQERGIPQLHFCWSHQAHAIGSGGRVTRGDRGRRFGVEKLVLTPEGRRDPLFVGMADVFEMFTSHTDVVTTLPNRPGVRPVELAHSNLYRNEALSFGASTRTVQVHPEMTSEFLVKLAAMRRQQLVDEGYIGRSDDDYESFVLSMMDADRRIRVNALRMVDNWMGNFVGEYFLRGPVSVSK